MRRLILLPLVLAVLVIAPTAAADTKTVQITRTAFTPATTTITSGDTVTFHNADTQQHQVVANDGSFASPVLSPDQTYSVTLSKEGRVRFHDGLVANRAGSIIVNGPPAGLTLAASDRVVTYGGSTMLTGAISSKQASQSVVLNAQPVSKSAFRADQTTTAADGSFHFGVAPTIETTYRAQWQNATSPAVTVFVAPRVGFGHSGRLYSARVTSDLNYAGHFVFVQRRTAFGWRSIKKVFLGGSSTARFTVKVPRHQRSFLRLFLTNGQAGAGYVQSLSRTIAVFRR
jgi:plastocyanin